MSPDASSNFAFRHSRRVISEPDEFSDVASGIELSVDFQRRREGVSRVEQFQSPDWALDLGHVNVSTRVRGILQGGWASLCIQVGPSSTQWNGHSSDQGFVSLLPPGEELDGRCAAGFKWLTVAVPPSVWERCHRLALNDKTPPQRLSVHRLPSQILSRFSECLRHLTTTLRTSAGTGPEGLLQVQSEVESFVERCFVTTCELATKPHSLRESYYNRVRLARRAEAWMRDHLSEPVQVPDVCLAFRVSRRELEYAFRTTFDQSPRDHLQTLRLNAIRRALQHGDAPITDIAYEHGITHLSRFAASYHTLFGEKPSQTIRATPLARAR